MPSKTFRISLLVAIIFVAAGITFFYAARSPSVNQVQTSVVYPISVIDDLGRNISIVKPPQRIVSLIPSATQIVFAIGAGDKVVGVTRYDDYPPELVDLVNNGTIANVGGGLDPDVEAVVQLRPDLILVAGPGEVSSQAIEKLQQLGYITLALDAHSFEGVLHAIQLVGTIMGYSTNAEKVVANINNTVNDVHYVTRNSTRPTVYIENWNDPLITAGNGSLQNDMVQLAGGTNIFSDLQGYQVSSEAVIVRNPEIIISFDSFENVSQIIARPGWGSISAVKENRVYEMNPEQGAPNPRIGQSILKMAELIHPNLFSQQAAGHLILARVFVTRTSD